MDAEEPWGAHAPNSIIRGWIALCRSLPPAPPFRRLGIWLRSPVKRMLRGPVDTRLWGLRLRLHPRGNLSEARWLFLPQFADRREREALAQRLQPGDLFVDIGANAGLYSFWVWSRFGDRVRVEAFEPDPGLCARIHFNLAVNGVGSIRLNPVALSDTEGVARLRVGTRNRGTNRIAAQTEEGVEVPLTTLAAFAAANGLARIDALKIDVEGHEAPILSHFFAHAPVSLRPRLLICETLGPDAGADPLHRALREAGYAPLLRGRMNTVFELRPGG